MDPLDGRRLEVENLAATSVLLEQQLQAWKQRTDGGLLRIKTKLVLLADFNLDHGDPAFEALQGAAKLRPHVRLAGGTMVKSEHSYDNIWISPSSLSPHQQPDSRQKVGKQKVGDVLRSGGVNLAAMMDAAAAVAVAEDGLIREKSGRSEAFDQLSDHLRESIFS